MPQPILRTDRLLLVPLADRHLELEIQLDSDPEVLRYLFGRARSRDEVLASHAQRMALARNVVGLGYWMAFGSGGGARDSTSPAREDEGEFIGLLMLPPAHGPDQPDDPTVAELGYRLVRRHWRKGLASEASRALLRHAFDTVGQSRVIAQTMAVNAGSRGVMEAIGMRYVRTYFPTWDEPLPGADLGEVEYEMTRGMWEASDGRNSTAPPTGEGLPCTPCSLQ
ncbi:Protein N-acetyltransferase, RimJ/RimL family [Micromonospora coriariae]|uniref:Protein N-acetyltransferase, RimJ/RimL family n=1 Tax=Micromonospora coriariae TaxID=285665 RepID=A0A1C4XV23_9ACTN|nr:GNAT family N-acetyltransferase [Micromonospora coriariae]SCF12252.1 Protein N-acetyltransferase, RimJ/RimL family [Micromonospora coriariae]